MLLSGDFPPSVLDSVFSFPFGLDVIVKAIELARHLLQLDQSKVIPLVLATQVVLPVVVVLEAFVVSCRREALIFLKCLGPVASQALRSLTQLRIEPNVRGSVHESLLGRLLK